MSERFYVNSPLAPGPIEIDGPEAHHLAAVCRVRPGDRVVLFNGDGREYPALVVDTAKRHVTLDVTGVASPQRELGFRLEVASPLPRGDREQFLVEKLTELGVTHFVPLVTARSVVQPREKQRDRLTRYVIEASKQCGRNVLMGVEAPAAWEEYIGRASLPTLRILAHPGEAPGLGEIKEAGDVAVAVGPEGGFTEDEVTLARGHGWQAVSLGPRVLRVETAALVLAAWAGSRSSTH